MNKYNVGDKVVIRKDLVVDEYYGGFIWYRNMQYMKEKNYVIIEQDFEGGFYWTTNEWVISDEMIEGLYGENFEIEKPNLKGSINDNIEYKVDDPVLFVSITSFHIDSLINKALEENNTEMLLEISNYMKEGEHIDIA